MTKELFKQAPVIWDAVSKSKNVLLHCHPGPDGDSVGGALAFYHLLKGLGNNPTVIAGDSPIPLGLSKLPGAKHIVEKNFLELDLQNFDTFLILDSSSLDMVSKKGQVIFPISMQTIVIDHHKSNQNFGQINLVDDSYIATCQMLYELFKEWQVKISPEMAVCLMVGIYVDSGGFRYERTTDQTFEAGVELARLNPEYTRALFELDNNNSPSKIYFQALALNSVQTFFDGQVAISSVSLEMMLAKGIDPEKTDKSEVSNLLKSVIGWEIGASLVEREKGLVDISLRTRNPEKYDLSKLAASLGGGGHPAAAGATVSGDVTSVKKLLLDKLAEIARL